jgi:hypothetical protein
MATGVSRLKPLGVALISAIAALAMAGPSPAVASHVECGDVITTDVTLDSDLLDCPDNGIVIGAGDLRIDLNGHRITGDGEPVKTCPNGSFCDVGILNDGHDGVRVEDGAVREFTVGLFAGRAVDAKVIHVVAAKHLEFGFIVAESRDSVIRRSTGSRNSTPEGDGIGVFDSANIRILRSDFGGNGELGVHVAGSRRIALRRAVVARSPLAVLVEDGRRNRIAGSRIARSGGGIVLLGDRNTVLRNRIARIEDVGISLEDGHANRILANRVRWTMDTGIRVVSFDDSQRLGRTDVARNLILGAGRDGIAVGRTARGTLLAANRVLRSEDDGIRTRGSTTTIARNTAVRNRDLGIAAVPGVTDGGGNMARLNGNPVQCTFVACG